VLFMVPAYVLIACQKMSLGAENGQVFGNRDRVWFLFF